MGPEVILTRVEWMPRVHYIFASLVREVSGEECDELCKTYLAAHKKVTLPGEALFVDLRPAFRQPHQTSKKFRSVPISYTPRWLK
jgi:hypothetical protein